MNELSRRGLGLGFSLLAAGCATGAIPAEQPPAPELHARLAFLARFVGAWRGAAEGEPGRGEVHRSYVPILGGRFIEERNTSRYASGEIHQHVGYWSFDRNRSRAVLRHFHVEGFVNTFVATTPDFVDGVLVMESEAIENIPAGYRAREAYRFMGSDAFEEEFEIAQPNADFARYSLNILRRA